MARLNARQARTRKRKLALLELANARNPSTQPIEGEIRSSAKPHVIRDNQLLKGIRLHTPKPVSEGRGLRGKVVKGHFKPVRPGTKSRWGIKS